MPLLVNDSPLLAQEKKLPEEVLQLIRQTNNKGHKVQLIQTVDAMYQVLDIDSSGEKIIYLNHADKVQRPECKLIIASNTLVQNPTSTHNSRRPAHPYGFMVSDDKRSCKSRLSEVINGYTQDMLHTDTMDWLSGQDIAIIPFKIADRFFGLHVLPVGIAWQFMQWNVIQDVMTETEIENATADDYDTVFYSAIGLRHSVFSEMQTTIFNRAPGMIKTYSTSSYPGLAGPKKSVFMFLSQHALDNGGLLYHGTLAKIYRKAGAISILYCARSAGGKTEMRLRLDAAKNAAGELIIGYCSLDGGVHFTLPAKIADIKVQGFGDDGVIFDDVTTHPKRARNTEKGAFDRPNSARKKGDLPESDKTLSASTPRNRIMCCFDAKPGRKVEAWHHTIEKGKPHSNPRDSYSIKALQAAGIDFGEGSIDIDCAMIGITTAPETAPWSLMHKMPWKLWALHFIAPWTAAKSVSVSDTGGKKMIIDAMGTCGVFCLPPNVHLANAHYQHIKRLAEAGVNFYVTPVKHLGPNYEVGYRAEWVARNSLSHAADGLSHFEFEPAASSLYGYCPKPEAMTLLGHKLPEDVCRINMQNTEQYFATAAAQKEAMMGFFNTFSDHPELISELKSLIQYFENMQVNNITSNQREEILAEYSKL